MVTLVATRTNDLPGALAALSEATDDQPHLPIVAVVVGGGSRLKLGKGNLPVYELPEDAVRSLGHACRYARWRREPTGSKPLIPGIDRNAAKQIVAEAVADGAGWQPVAVTHALMTCYGIPLLETRLATSIETAEETARELGFPIVMKATGPDSHTKASWAAYASDSPTGQPCAGRTWPSRARSTKQSPRLPCNGWSRPAWNSSSAWSMILCSARSSWSAWEASTPTYSGTDHFGRCR